MDKVIEATLKMQQWRLHSQRTSVLHGLILISVLVRADAVLNCSQPNTQSLLAAFKENVFNLSEVRPVADLNNPVVVQVFFTVYGILDVDEKAQLLTTYIWLSLSWQNEFVTWDPEGCGTSKVSLPRASLWSPDIVINEFMEANNAPETYFVYVYNDGTVLDMLPVKVVSSCNLEIYTFPFDIQNCTYTFNSYLHAADGIRLNLAATANEILVMSNNFMEMKGEWELINMTSRHDNISNPQKWDFLYIHLVLRRHPTLYVVNLLVPSCFLMTLDLFSFLLPPQSVDRSAFKMTLILGYTVFLLLMNDLLPVTGNTIPLINVFFSLCLALMVASLLETVIITNILHTNWVREVPEWCRVLILGVLARLVCLSRKMPEDQVAVMHNQAVPSIWCTNASESAAQDVYLEAFQKVEQELQAIRKQLEKNTDADQAPEDWMYVGQVIDRFLFCIYIIFIVISFITVLVIWTRWHSSG